MDSVIITGGAGFIGSALTHHLLLKTNYRIVIVDKLTYASNPEYIEELNKIYNRVTLVAEDINSRFYIKHLLHEYKPVGVFHLAAESHVDNSISSPRAFIDSNILGTYELLEAIRVYKKDTNKDLRLLHVSTDEVFGDLDSSEEKFNELSRYQPSSPYSATKAASDHLVRSWGRTYNLDTVVTNCSNNYGPRQHSEKLIPAMINKALRSEPLTVYGDGSQIRDWLHVDDHVNALLTIFEKSAANETYCIGGNNEIRNIDLVNEICSIIENIVRIENVHRLITFVPDRPGHDVRYAIDSSKLQTELNWAPSHDFNSGLLFTVRWFINKYLHDRY